VPALLHPSGGQEQEYPLNLILQAVSTFNLGYSLTDTPKSNLLDR